MIRCSTDTAAHRDVIGTSSNVVGRDGGLDLLRGVAMLSVVLFHLDLHPARAIGSGARLIRRDLDWSAGRLGLVLFFVLSGYLL